VDPVDSGKGPMAVCGNNSDEPSGSVTTELVIHSFSVSR
jgi:hypothetical protein